MARTEYREMCLPHVGLLRTASIVSVLFMIMAIPLVVDSFIVKRATTDVSICDFEVDDLCGFIQATNDNFDWTKRSGKTNTPSTGPTTDHTYAMSTDIDGSYMYIEATGIPPGSKANLIWSIHASQNGEARDCTVKVWYHMFGDHMGTLNIVVSDDASNTLAQWTKSGDQENEWHEGSLSFKVSSSDVWINVEGVRGPGYRSDIAIDDVEIQCGVSGVDECLSGTHNCHMEATCTDTTESFTCMCNDGFTGDGISCSDVNECARGSDNCHAHASCTNTAGSFTCTCDDGYSGDGMSCSDVNECARESDNCHAHASCTNTAGSFTCTCDDGYSGDGVSCSDMNECARGTDNCHAQALCTNTAGSFTCACDSGYSGDGVSCSDIDECLAGSNNCDAQATCTNTPGSFTCECNSGYVGDGTSCSVSGSIDECSSGTHTCHLDATCTDTADSYTCTCNSGFFGDGISCTASSFSFCDFEREGICEYVQASDDDFDWEKESGRTSTSSTGPTVDHTLMSSDGSYMHIDATGQETGDKARLYRFYQAPINNRLKMSCQFLFWYHMYGTDIGTLNIYAYNFNKTIPVWTKSGNQLDDIWQKGIARVPLSDWQIIGIEGIRGTGIRGDIAIDDLEFVCDLDACELGINNCHPQATCTNTRSGYSCVCNDGYEGDGSFCSDINECARIGNLDNCHGLATCINTPGSYTCDCGSGYIGDGTFCTDIDECTVGTHNCHAQAKCTNTSGSFMCTCKEGYVGDGVSCEASGVWFCDFESEGTCGLTQASNDDFDWSKQSYNGHSFTSGPETDHTLMTGDGAYMFIKTSSYGVAVGDVARIYLLYKIPEDIYPSATACQFLFWYNMDRSDRTLNVYAYNPDETVLVWTETGKGIGDDRWQEGMALVPLSRSHWTVGIVIEGIKGTTSYGDPAIDDLELICGLDKCTSSTNDCHPQASCTNTRDSYSCVCKDGYEGDGSFCTDINECARSADNCHRNALCRNTEGSYICECRSGFTGDGTIFCIVIDECTTGTHDCHEHATCTNTPGSFTCSCDTGYEGYGTYCTDSCTFQDSLTCGYSHQNSDAFDWIRDRGPAPGGYPSSDHTWKTDYGYYMYANTAQQQYGAKARLVGPWTTIRGTKECYLSFYSYQSSHYNYLNVYGKTLTEEHLIVANANSLMNTWIFHEVSVYSTDISFQIVFEAVSGSFSRDGIIAIDDVEPLYCY